MKNFFKKFKLDFSTDALAYFEKAKADLSKRGSDIMNFERFGIFAETRSDIARIRDDLISDEDNVLYAYMLASALRAKDKKTIILLSSPCKEMHSEIYDTLPLFSLLDLADDMVKEHKKRGIPDSVTQDTLAMFENQMGDFYDLNHHIGISDYVTWMLGFLECRLIRIGRFNFEITSYDLGYEIFTGNGEIEALASGITFHRSGLPLGSRGCAEEAEAFTAEILETDEYYEGFRIVDGICTKETLKLKKSEWKKCLSKGDPIISIHVPSGGPLTEEVCNRDIAEARRLFPTAISDFKAFYMHTWLLDPSIKKLINKETNLTKFAKRFKILPTKSRGEDVFTYVFSLPANTPPENLPEHTSFAKAVKEHLIAGGNIYEFAGIFL